MKKYKLVYIDWFDAMQNISSWIDEEEAIECSDNNEGLVKQVGWLIKKTNNYLLLASRLGQINPPSTDLCGVFKIPTKWVKRIDTISFC